MRALASKILAASLVFDLVVFVHLTPAQPIAQQAYFKDTNTAFFGSSVAVSGDTVVVGTGDQSGNLNLIGEAYVFVRSGTNWIQQAVLKASNAETNDAFGTSVAIDRDTVVVGAYLEDSNATGVNGNQNDNSAADSGAAYVFVRSGTNWTQQAYLKASNTGAGDNFSYALAVAGDMIVVGSWEEDSNATGINGNQNNNSAPVSGAAYAFVRNGTNWTQQAYLKASNTGADDQFGGTVTVSGDTVVVGAPGEASNATGVNGNQINNSAVFSGAAYVFVRDGTNWTQQAYLKASNTDELDGFGYATAISGDTIVVGAWVESSGATGVNGNQGNNDFFRESGAAYVFVRTATNWVQQAYLKASNTERYDVFGSSVAVSGDTIVVGAPSESSGATGIDGNQTDNSVPYAGAAYVFTRQGTNWTQRAYLKGAITGVNYSFGSSVGVSGTTLVAGALGETNNGAAYVFTAVQVLPELHLTATRNGDLLQLTATGTTNTQWQLEFRDSLTDTNAWQPLTNITLGSDAFILDEPLTARSRFYRGVWLP